MPQYTVQAGEQLFRPIFQLKNFMVGRTKKIKKISFAYRFDENCLSNQADKEYEGRHFKSWKKLLGPSFSRRWWHMGFKENNENAVLAAWRSLDLERPVIQVTPYFNKNFEWWSGEDTGKILEVPVKKEMYGDFIRHGKGDWETILWGNTPDETISMRGLINEQKWTEMTPPYYGGQSATNRLKSLSASFTKK